MALTDSTLPKDVPQALTQPLPNDLPHVPTHVATHEVLRARLVARGASLLAAIGTHRDQLQQPAAATGNTFIAGSEGAVADADDEIEVALWQRLQHEFDEVELALRRLDTPDYGHCESCHEAIESARLDAQPEARRCLRCQAIAEAHTGNGVRASAWGT